MYRYFSKRAPRRAHPLVAGIMAAKAATRLGVTVSGEMLKDKERTALRARLD
jgi:hypothetical protein